MLMVDKVLILVYILSMTQVIPVTQVRKDLLRIVDKIDEEYTRVDLSKNGRVKAALVSSEYLDSLEETIYSLKYSLSDIRDAEKQIKEGKYITLSQFKKQLKRRNVC